MGVNYSNINIEEILEFYSINNVRRYGEEINFSCPFPEHPFGDRNPSAYINIITGRWHCFSCGRKGSLVNFVADHEDITYSQALSKITDNNLGAFQNQSLSEALDKAMRPKIPERERTISEDALLLFSVDWKKVEDTENAPTRLRYIIERGFSSDTLIRYDIGFDPESKRITIPIRNNKGKLVGFKGRATRRGQRPKYLPIGDKEDQKHYGFYFYKKSYYVYGLDSAAGSHGIIVEGELDTLWLRQLGFSSAVSISGSDPSERQIREITKKFTSVTLLLDNDEGGDKARRKLAQNLVEWMPVKVARLEKGDPQENTKEQIEHALNTSINTLKVKEN